MFRTPQSDSESDDEQCPIIHTFTTNHMPGCNHGEFDRPSLKTPFRPKDATASSTSSSSSSSTTSIIFDEGLTRAGTPLTPPESDTLESSNAGTLRLSSHGILSTNSFVKKCLDASNIPSTTPTPATSSTAKRLSQHLSDSDYELLVEGVEKLSIQDHKQASNTGVSVGLDKSPILVSKPQLKEMSHQAMEGDDDYYESPVKNAVSNHKIEHENTPQTDKTSSAEPKVQRSLNLAGARDTPRSNMRKNAETPSLVITQIDSEGKEVDAESSGTTAQNLPCSVQYRQRATLSVPRTSHKRSTSAPGPHKKSNTIVQDTSIASTRSRKASSTQTNKVGATPLPAPTRCRFRRHSTGSIVPEHTVLPPIGFSTPSDHGIPSAFLNEPINSKVSRRIPPFEPLERTPDSNPDETPKSPKLEDMHPEKKNENDLKNEILRLIRRQKSKPAVASTSKYGFVYIFKSDKFPGHVKIGSTVKAPETRIKEWGTACKFKAIRVTDKNDTAFRFCRIVEQIVHAELYNEQRKFYCNECKMKHRLTMAERQKRTGDTELDVRPTEHGEWFEISETKALEVVSKWRDWMIHQEPYKEDATLRSCWIWKYDMGTKWMKGTEEEWEVWRQFGWFDQFWFNLYDFNKWLGEVSSMLQKLLNSPRSILVLAAGFYLWTVGVDSVSSLEVAIALLLYRFMCFKFC